MLDPAELRDYYSRRFTLDSELELNDLNAAEEWQGRLWGYVRSTPERWAARAAQTKEGAVVLLIPAHTKAEWWYRYVVDKASRVILIREAIDKQPYAVVVWDNARLSEAHVVFVEWNRSKR